MLSAQVGHAVSIILTLFNVHSVRELPLISGPVHTPLQPASRPAEQMEDFQIGSLPLWGRANMPAEMGPAYGKSDDRLLRYYPLHLSSSSSALSSVPPIRSPCHLYEGATENSPGLPVHLLTRSLPRQC